MEDVELFSIIPPSAADELHACALLFDPQAATWARRANSSEYAGWVGVAEGDRDKGMGAAARLSALAMAGVNPEEVVKSAARSGRLRVVVQYKEWGVQIYDCTITYALLISKNHSFPCDR